jgi:hypothetical protein
MSTVGYQKLQKVSYRREVLCSIARTMFTLMAFEVPVTVVPSKVVLVRGGRSPQFPEEGGGNFNHLIIPPLERTIEHLLTPVRLLW